MMEVLRAGLDTDLGAFSDSFSDLVTTVSGGLSSVDRQNVPLVLSGNPVICPHRLALTNLAELLPTSLDRVSFRAAVAVPLYINQGD